MGKGGPIVIRGTQMDRREASTYITLQRAHSSDDGVKGWLPAMKMLVTIYFFLSLSIVNVLVSEVTRKR